MSNFNPKNQVKKQRVSDFVSIRDSQRYLSGATTFYHMRNYQVAEAGAASTTSNAWDWNDTEIEIHILRFWNVAHKFGAGEYVQTIDVKMR